jgi:hypothetical protein
LLAHIQNTRAHYQLPAFARRLADPANRTGVSEHFSDPSVRKNLDVDLALLERCDPLITDLGLTIVRARSCSARLRRSTGKAKRSRFWRTGVGIGV